MQSAFGVEHGDSVSKGMVSGTGNFFRGIAGKAEGGLKAPKNAKPSEQQWAAPTTSPVTATGSKGFERGAKSRDWMKKNPLKTAGAATGLGAGAGYGANEGYKQRYG